jgi:Xaa-Pro aminopeptidase
MRKESIDCLIVTKESNFVYSIGYEASGYLFIRPEEVNLILPRFYLYDLEEYDAEYFFTAEESKEKLSNLSEEMSGKVVTDADNPQVLNEIFGAEHSEIMTDLRLRKTDKEVEKIKEACRITDNALTELRPGLFSGKTELEAQLELKKYYSNQKVSESFITNEGESLVQKNCLKPHRPSKDVQIHSDDLVIVDTGARKGLYCADVTRTYCRNPSERRQDLFEAVKKVQSEMIEMISPGVQIREVVERQLELTEELGYNPEKNVLYFSHGIGIDVHESPSISLSTDRKFKEDMVVTVEPGIHLPELGGVRMEDTVHVGSSKNRRLSKVAREL